MNHFIKVAITDRLKELVEEQESLDMTINERDKELIRLKKVQKENAIIIKDTVDFLKKANKRHVKTEAPPTQEQPKER